MLDILRFSASKENHIALSLGCLVTLASAKVSSEAGWSRTRRDETQELDAGSVPRVGFRKLDSR